MSRAEEFELCDDLSDVVHLFMLVLKDVFLKKGKHEFFLLFKDRRDFWNVKRNESRRK